MLYVLEGCDGAGKTELANFLAEILRADIIHCSTHTPNDYPFFSSIINASETRNIIADRFCYGQFIYQKPEDRPLSRSFDGAEKTLYTLEREMLYRGAKTIYVTAPAETIKSRLAARGEILINGLTVEEILSKYDNIIKNSLLPWTVYNTGRC